MTQVTIKVYRSNGAAGDRAAHARGDAPGRELNPMSRSPRNAQGRSSLASTRVRSYRRCVGVIRTREGWQVSRALQPTDRCGYHFIWEEVVVYED